MWLFCVGAQDENLTDINFKICAIVYILLLFVFFKEVTFRLKVITFSKIMKHIVVKSTIDSRIKKVQKS